MGVFYQSPNRLDMAILSTYIACAALMLPAPGDQGAACPGVGIACGVVACGDSAALDLISSPLDRAPHSRRIYERIFETALDDDEEETSHAESLGLLSSIFLNHDSTPSNFIAHVTPAPPGSISGRDESPILRC